MQNQQNNQNNNQTNNTQKLCYIETYGCTANQNNSEIVAGMLTQHGFIITNNPEISDIIILNTCVVKDKTISKIKRRIQDLKQFSSNKNKLLIIAGCMPETEKLKKLRNLNPNLIFLGTHHFKDIINLLRDYNEKKLDEKKQQEYIGIEKENKKEIKLCLPKIPANKLISITQISEGCLGNCSFCLARLAKHSLFSYPKEQILKSIESDLQNNAKEIWLTCQDCASYGLDWNNKEKKHRLPELLKEILSLKHKFKLRLGMMDINNVLPVFDDLLGIYKNPKIYKFLHIPIQSASNKILKHMNRFYTIEQAERIIEKFRTSFPNGVIATDIIVGYPAETEEEHKQNMQFIEKFQPDILNLSKFSSHKQTPAGKLKKIKNSIIKKRTTELMKLHRETSKQNKEKYLNKKIKVFINRKIQNSQSLHEARDENYNIILLKCEKEMLGKEAEVKITEIGVHHMFGEPVK
jgi:MiaB-like tRNA modifying enzyme